MDQGVSLVKLSQRLKRNSERIRIAANKLGASSACASKIQDIFDIPLPSLNKVLKKILSTECRELLKYEADMHILLNPALQLHLEFGPTVIDLTSYLSYCPIHLKFQYLKSAIIQISRITPNIEEVILKSKTPREDIICESAVDSEMLEALGKLTKLEVLQLDDWCCFHINDLLDVCEKLPRLKVVSILFHEEFSDVYFKNYDAESSAIGERLAKSMPSVEDFIYHVPDYALFKNLCLEYLPHLRTVREFTSVFSASEDLNSLTQNKLCNGTSNLHHLHLDFEFGDYGVENMELKFPYVRHVQLVWYADKEFISEQWKLVLKLNQINSLNLMDFPQHVIMEFLAAYGLNLEVLNIKGSDETLLSLSQILSTCPKLKILHLESTIDDPHPSITFFAELNEVDLNLSMISERRDELINILRAPDLEKVTLHGDYLNVGDLKKLNLAIAKKQIMQKVSCLIIELPDYSFDDVNANLFKELSEFMKCAVKSLTQLTCLKFFMNSHLSEYSILARSLRDGKTKNEEYPDVVDFFLESTLDSSKDFFVDEELISILETYRDE